VHTGGTPEAHRRHTGRSGAPPVCHRCTTGAPPVRLRCARRGTSAFAPCAAIGNIDRRLRTIPGRLKVAKRFGLRQSSAAVGAYLDPITGARLSPAAACPTARGGLVWSSSASRGRNVLRLGTAALRWCSDPWRGGIDVHPLSRLGLSKAAEDCRSPKRFAHSVAGLPRCAKYLYGAGRAHQNLSDADSPSARRSRQAPKYIFAADRSPVVDLPPCRRLEKIGTSSTG
jgi:hypothetical protein